jgi:hypothetical protein
MALAGMFIGKGSTYSRGERKATMKRIHKRIIGSVAMVSILSLGGAIGLGGVPSSMTAAAATSRGIESFWVSGFTVSNQNPTTIVATGLFSDAGTLSGPSANRATLSQGGLSVNSKALKPSFKLNPLTCFFSVSYRGSISLEHGTGAYAGISGTLTVSGSEQGIAMKVPSGKCEGGKTPALGVTGLITARGKVSLGS